MKRIIETYLSLVFLLVMLSLVVAGCSQCFVSQQTVLAVIQKGGVK